MTPSLCLSYTANREGGRCERCRAAPATLELHWQGGAEVRVERACEPCLREAVHALFATDGGDGFRLWVGV